MGANIGGLQGIIRGIVARSIADPAGRRERKTTPGEMERVRSGIQNVGRGTFLGGISPFGGGRKRGQGLFGGGASTAAQQTFGT